MSDPKSRPNKKISRTGQVTYTKRFNDDNLYTREDITKENRRKMEDIEDALPCLTPAQLLTIALLLMMLLGVCFLFPNEIFNLFNH